MNYSEVPDKDDILNKLPSNLRNSFEQCIGEIEHGKYRGIANLDDAFSAAINEGACKACRQVQNQEIRNNIDKFIRALIDSTRK